MFTYDPTDVFDVDNAKRLEAKPWMLELLALNPRILAWVNEDDMASDEDGGRLQSIEVRNWRRMPKLELGKRNEILSFCFVIERVSRTCKSCLGSGFGPEARQLDEDFYDPDGAGRRWCDKITLDECQALVEEQRVDGPATEVLVEKINAANRRRTNPRVGFDMGLVHDAINRYILIRARATRQGVKHVYCQTCESHGDVYIGEPYVKLTLWLAHNMTGTTRLMNVNRIDHVDLPAVFEMLKTAAASHVRRFTVFAEPARSQA